MRSLNEHLETISELNEMDNKTIELLATAAGAIVGVIGTKALMTHLYSPKKLAGYTKKQLLKTELSRFAPKLISDFTVAIEEAAERTTKQYSGGLGTITTKNAEQRGAFLDEVNRLYNQSVTPKLIKEIEKNPDYVVDANRTLKIIGLRDTSIIAPVLGYAVDKGWMNQIRANMIANRYMYKSKFTLRDFIEDANLEDKIKVY